MRRAGSRSVSVMTRSAQRHSDICAHCLYKSGLIGHFRRHRTGNPHAIPIRALIRTVILVLARRPRSSVPAARGRPTPEKTPIRPPCGAPSCLHVPSYRPRRCAPHRRTGSGVYKVRAHQQTAMPAPPAPSSDHGPVRMSWVPMRRQITWGMPGQTSGPYCQVARPAGPVPMDQVIS